MDSERLKQIEIGLTRAGFGESRRLIYTERVLTNYMPELIEALKAEQKRTAALEGLLASYGIDGDNREELLERLEARKVGRSEEA
jgi:hypothetical protein